MTTTTATTAAATTTKVTLPRDESKQRPALRHVSLVFAAARLGTAFPSAPAFAACVCAAHVTWCACSNLCCLQRKRKCKGVTESKSDSESESESESEGWSDEEDDDDLAGDERNSCSDESESESEGSSDEEDGGSADESDDDDKHEKVTEDNQQEEEEEEEQKENHSQDPTTDAQSSVVIDEEDGIADVNSHPEEEAVISPRKACEYLREYHGYRKLVSMVKKTGKFPIDWGFKVCRTCRLNEYTSDVSDGTAYAFLACCLSPVACRLSPVACCRLPRSRFVPSPRRRILGPHAIHAVASRSR